MQDWMKLGLAAFVTTLVGAWRTDFRAYREAKAADPTVRYDWGLMGERILGALDAAMVAAAAAAGLGSVE